MKTVFLMISILIFAVGILGITNHVPPLFLGNSETGYTFLLATLVVLGVIYAFINPLLIFYEKMIVIALLCVVLYAALEPGLSSLLTIKLNMTLVTRSITVLIASTLGMVYSIFAPA